MGNIPQCLRVVTVVTVHGVWCVRVGVRCVKSRPSVYPWRTLCMVEPPSNYMLRVHFIEALCEPLKWEVLR